MNATLDNGSYREFNRSVKIVFTTGILIQPLVEDSRGNIQNSAYCRCRRGRLRSHAVCPHQLWMPQWRDAYLNADTWKHVSLLLQRRLTLPFPIALSTDRRGAITALGAVERDHDANEHWPCVYFDHKAPNSEQQPARSIHSHRDCGLPGQGTCCVIRLILVPNPLKRIFEEERLLVAMGTEIWRGGKGTRRVLASSDMCDRLVYVKLWNS